MLFLYRLLTYVLLPFGAIMALMTLIALPAALNNIAALLPAFLCGATVIYLVSSFNFLHRGILAKVPQKPSLFDWIRVNGIVALFLGAMFMFQSVFFWNNTEISEQLQAQMELMAGEAEADKLPDVGKIVRSVLIFMFCAGLILIVHVLQTLVLLKKNRSLFGNPLT